MSAPQFTNAPWSAIPDDRDWYIAASVGRMPTIIADLEPIIPGEAVEANARLIAAAPELYEALTAAANALQQQARMVTEHGSSPALIRKQAVLQEQADAAFAALAKARGDA